MNEYFVQYLNNIHTHIIADGWKDAIIEAKLNGERKGFSNCAIKMIMDEDGTIIRNINLQTLEFTCGTQAIDVKVVI